MYSAVKRVFDVVGAGILLILISPLFAVIALVLYVFNRGEVFFVQERPGKNERPFRLIKFKTMRDVHDPMGNLLPDEQRVYPLGMFLRKTSLDELPQLVNILKGDLSFVGPRPLLTRYLPFYSETEKIRHHVRPGLTGWAQANGRNSIDWNTRLAMDVWYVENCSFTLDLKILYLTAKKVLSRENVTVSSQQIGPIPLDEVRGGRSG